MATDLGSVFGAFEWRVKWMQGVLDNIAGVGRKADAASGSGRKLGDAFDSAGRKGSKGVGVLGSALGGVAKIAGGILAAQVIQKIGGAVVGMFQGAIDYGSDAEETASKFAITFGEAGDALNERLSTFSDLAGRSSYALVGMAADFGAVLKGMSLTSDVAAEYSGNLAELAVDVGSFMNAQAPEVMDKFRAAMTGEYESLKSLGIVINQAAVDQELLTLGVEGGAKAATEAQLVQARYNLLLQKTSDAQGDAERTAGSWANVQVRLKGVWQDLLTTIGRTTTASLAPMLSGLVTAFKTVATAMTDALSRPEVQAWLMDTATMLGDLAVKVGEVVAMLVEGDVAGVLEVAFGPETADRLISIGSAIGSVVEWLGLLDPVAVAAGGSFIGIGLAVAQVLLHIPQIITAFAAVKAAVMGLTVVMAANPLILIATGIVAAGLAIATVISKINAKNAELDAATAATNQKIQATAPTWEAYVAQMIEAERATGRIPPGMSDVLAAERMVEAGLIQGKAAWQAERGELELTTMAMSNAALVRRRLADEMKYGMAELSSLPPINFNMDPNQFAEAGTVLQNFVATAQASAQQVNTVMGEALADPVFVSALADSAARAEEIMADLQDNLIGITTDGWDTQTGVWEESTGALGELMQRHLEQVSESEFQYRTTQSGAEQVYQAQRQALLAANKTKEIADLDAKHAESTNMAARDHSVQQQMQKRNLLIQQHAQAMAYIEELKSLAAKARQALAAKLIESKGFQDLEYTTQLAILAEIDLGAQKQYKAEREIAESVVKINAEKGANVVEMAANSAAAVAALAGGSPEAIALAEREASRLRNLIKNFSISIPPPNMTAFQAGISAGGANAGASAQKATETATRPIEEIISAIGKSLEEAKDAIRNFADFDIPAGTEEGLDRFGEFVKMVVKKVYGWIDEPVIEGSKTKIKSLLGDVRSSVERIQTLLDLVAWDPSKVKPAEGDFAANALAYFDQLMYFANETIRRLGHIDKDTRKALEAAAGVVDLYKSLFALIGVALDKIVPSKSKDFETDVNAYFGQQETVAVRVVSWLGRIDEAWTKTLTNVQPLVDKIKTVLGLGGATDFAKIKPAGSETFQADVDQHFIDLEWVAESALASVHTLWAKWGEAFNLIAPYVAAVKTVLTLGGSIDFDKLVPAGGVETFHADVDQHFVDLEWVATSALASIYTLWAKWGEGFNLMAPYVAAVKTVLSLGGSIDFDKLKIGDSATFRQDVDQHFVDLEWVAWAALASIHTLWARWGEAFNIMAPYVDSVKKVLSLGGSVEMAKLVPSDAVNFKTDVDAYFMQQESVLESIMAWLGRMTATAKAAVLENAPFADAIGKLVGLLGASLAFETPRSDFGAALDRFVIGFELAVKTMLTSIQKIKAGPLGDSLKEAAEAAGQIKSVTDLLNVSKVIAEVAAAGGYGDVDALATYVTNGIESVLDVMVPKLETLQAKYAGRLDGLSTFIPMATQRIKDIFGWAKDVQGMDIAAITSMNIQGKLAAILELFWNALGQIQSGAATLAPELPGWAAGALTANAGAGALNEAKAGGAAPVGVTLSVPVTVTFTGDVNSGDPQELVEMVSATLGDRISRDLYERLAEFKMLLADMAVTQAQTGGATP
jgi:hypothetical protein